MKWPSFLHQPMRHESACLDDGMAIAVRDKEKLTFAHADLGVDGLVGEMSAGKARGATGFVVGGRFCRFVSVPWSDLLLDSQGVNLHYRNAFADIFGDVAPGTLFAAADEPHGQARVVCALENGLIEALHAWAARHGRQVAFVRPAVQVAFEFFRQQMQGEAGVFALREPMVLSLLCWEAGRVVEIDSFPVTDGDWKTRLNDEVTRAHLQSGNGGTLYVADACSDEPEYSGDDDVVLQWPAFAKAAPNPMSRLAICGL